MCMKKGAQLRRVGCFDAEAFLQPAEWSASLVEQYQRLGGQLSSLRELEVSGGTDRLLSALCAVVSSAPHLTSVKFTTYVWLPRMELTQIRSASLESIIVTVLSPSDEAPPPPLTLTLLPECTRLQKVLVQIPDRFLTEGTTVKIRCHCGSPACLVPVDVHACAKEQRRVNGITSYLSEVGVQILPGPPSLQGARRCTVLYECHAAGPQQPLVWGHVVKRGWL